MCTVREGVLEVLFLYQYTLKPRQSECSKVRFLSVFTVKCISCNMCTEEDSSLFLNTNDLMEGKTIPFQKYEQALKIFISSVLKP